MTGKTVYVFNSYQPSIQDVEQCSVNNLSVVSNGSVDTMMCDCLDSLELSDRLNSLGQMFDKLKINGRIILKTINLTIFAKHIMQNRLSIEQINEILSNTRSMVDDIFLEHIISQHPNMKVVEDINDGLGKTLTIQRVS